MSSTQREVRLLVVTSVAAWIIGVVVRHPHGVVGYGELLVAAVAAGAFVTFALASLLDL